MVPALRALGVSRLDLLVVSHADLDHRGGAESVLSGVEVDELWLPVGSRSDPGFAALAEFAAGGGARVFERGAGHGQFRFGDLIVTPLWPPPEPPGRRSRNDRSLAIRVDGAAASEEATLFPEDQHLCGDEDRTVGSDHDTGEQHQQEVTERLATE